MIDNKSIRVVENRKLFYIISIVVIIVAFGFGAYNYSAGNGVFNLDVDFSGGTSLELEIGVDANVSDVEKIITDATGIASPRVQKIIGTTQVTVKTQKLSRDDRNAIMDSFTNAYPAASLLSYSDVSSTVSSEMQQKSIIAVLIACAAMLVYITIRFKTLKMGASAIAALLHDVLVMLAVYIIFRIPVNNSFIAAILTILGYSINATIVVFDRIRENKRFSKRNELAQLINTSITQTLARSINTSITTLLAITCVYVFGVTSVREFALPLVVGIISGAYSSIFFAGSVWYSLSSGEHAKSAVS